jgi:hypothetical protein
LEAEEVFVDDESGISSQTPPCPQYGYGFPGNFLPNQAGFDWDLSCYPNQTEAMSSPEYDDLWTYTSTEDRFTPDDRFMTDGTFNPDFSRFIDTAREGL